MLSNNFVIHSHSTCRRAALMGVGRRRVLSIARASHLDFKLPPQAMTIAFRSISQRLYLYRCTFSLNPISAADGAVPPIRCQANWLFIAPLTFTTWHTTEISGGALLNTLYSTYRASLLVIIIIIPIVDSRANDMIAAAVEWIKTVTKNKLKSVNNVRTTINHQSPFEHLGTRAKKKTKYSGFKMFLFALAYLPPKDAALLRRSSRCGESRRTHQINVRANHIYALNLRRRKVIASREQQMRVSLSATHSVADPHWKIHI